MCDCSEKAHLTPEQIEQGRLIIKNALIRYQAHLAAKFEDIFHPSNPRFPAPSVELCGKFAYSPKNEDKGDHKKRRRTSLGRYLNRQEGLPMDRYLESACNKAMAEVGSLYPIDQQFKILRGEDILEAYREKVGSESCMTGNDPDRQKVVKFYADNPDSVGLLVWRKTFGRALIWELPDDFGQYIDRIYAGNIDGAMTAYSQYAAAHNIQYSFEGELSGTSPIDELGDVEIKLNYTPKQGLPYFDSLSRSKGNVFIFRPGIECTSCGDFFDADDGVYIDCSDITVCQDCYESYYERCSCGSAFLTEDGMSVEGGDRYVCPSCSEDFTECDGCHEYWSMSYCTNNGELCENCLEDGGYMSCYDCGEYSDECEDVSDHCYCPHCLPEPAVA